MAIVELVEEASTEIVPGNVPGGPSTSQTIMVSSLALLFELLPADAPTDAYRQAIRDENVLGKRTAGAREWAFRQLRRFYALDPRSLLFRGLRDLWPSDKEGQPLLALMCAMARDPVLRASAPVVLELERGAEVRADVFEAAIEDSFAGVYAASTRQTTAQKLASSWTQSGHLHVGHSKRIRARAECTPSDVAYALLLGHLEGVRGIALFETLWAKVLDQPTSHLFDLAATASQQEMLELRQAGGVVEVGFRELLRPFDAGGHGGLL
jgi:hypothetical protein